MADLVTDIRDRLVTMIGSMTVAGGYNFDYDPTSINPNDGDLNNAFQSGDNYSDIFPLVFVEVGDETRVSGNAYATNSGHIVNDVTFDIVGMPYSDINDLDENCNKMAEDFKKLLFADPELRNVINGGTDCKAMFTQYVGNRRIVNTKNYINTSGGIIFTINVRYGQVTTAVGTLK